ncbi:hypothetical protein BTW15_27725 [Pseudomonas syringae pv. tomato]|uniref:Uncharacterized protein n=2 Tax=Pseudomonas syringae group TaxID=136849 RepID=I3W2K6_PSESX|nr:MULTISPECIES: hypothetical protein [Pseudomonas syringae group]AFK89833.1 hypothetical protein [Pseudomonas syringae]MBX6511287.1 hypothetical protein [Pseudomonas syringae pv. tomato]OPE56841.1 hypothetical protein BTW15_27725 [Pseudomonas syringae pv. tomato]TES71904.1 hypothetical protein E2N89_30145 [Pseudomonas syringae pv. tomato]
MNKVVHLPHGVRIKVDEHLACVEQAPNLHALELAQERAQGFIEGVEAAGVLDAARIETLLDAVDNAATDRRQELTTLSATLYSSIP